MPTERDKIHKPESPDTLKKATAAPAISREFFETRQKLADLGLLSNSVLTNPDIALNFRDEADRFFSKLRRNDPERMKEIEELGKDIKLSSETRSIRVIAAYVGEKELTQCLFHFAAQTNGNFETIIFLNAGILNSEHFSDSEEESRKIFEQQAKQRKQEISGVVSRYPHLKVHVVEKYFTRHETTLSAARALITETVCYKAAEAGIKDPIIIGNDADITGVANEYVEEIISQFDQSPLIDYVGGSEFYIPRENTPDSLGWQCPELLIGEFLHTNKVNISRSFDPDAPANSIIPINRKQLYIGTTGANMSFRASSYLASGGYDETIKTGSDQKLGHRFRTMRLPSPESPIHNPKHQRYSEKAMIISSPRRKLDAIIQGKSAAQGGDSLLSTPGSNLDDRELAEQYKQTPFLIQTEDIEKAFHGDKEALQKIKGRLEFTIRRFLIRHRISNPAFIEKFLEKAGISTTKPPSAWKFSYQGKGADGRNVISDDQIEGFEIDIEKTSLDYFYRYFKLK